MKYGKRAAFIVSAICCLALLCTAQFFFGRENRNGGRTAKDTHAKAELDAGDELDDGDELNGGDEEESDLLPDNWLEERNRQFALQYPVSDAFSENAISVVESYLEEEYQNDPDTIYFELVQAEIDYPEMERAISTFYSHFLRYSDNLRYSDKWKPEEFQYHFAAVYSTFIIEYSPMSEELHLKIVDGQPGRYQIEITYFIADREEKGWTVIDNRLQGRRKCD